MSIARLIKGFFKVLGVVLLTAALLITAMFAMGEALKDEETRLSPWGTGFFYVATGSMEPAIPTGSFIFITSVSEDDIRIDDVLTYYSGGRREIVTHRVRDVHVDNGNYTYTTRGDANNVDDPLLEYDRVIGRMLFTVPWSGALAGMHSNVTYFGIGIICFGIILSLTGIIGSFWKKPEKGEETDTETDSGSDEEPSPQETPQITHSRSDKLEAPEETASNEKKSTAEHTESSDMESVQDKILAFKTRNIPNEGSDT